MKRKLTVKAGLKKPPDDLTVAYLSGFYEGKDYIKSRLLTVEELGDVLFIIMDEQNTLGRCTDLQDKNFLIKVSEAIHETQMKKFY